jgi:hypothetical protein
MSDILVVIERPMTEKAKARLLKLFLFLTAFLLGWLGTHYVVAIFYPITGPICLWGVHFHHLYIGLILLSIGLLGYFFTNYKLFFLFTLAFGCGMALDDTLDHFILIIDLFQVWC